MIYGMLMTGGTILLMPRIVPNHSRTRFLTSYRSRLGSKRLRANADSSACGLIGYPPGRFGKSEKPHPSWLLELDPVFVSFLSTCSQIYHEAHLLPYTSNNFRVDCKHLPIFLEPRTLSQLQALRSIALSAQVYTKTQDRTLGEQIRAIADIITGVDEFKLTVMLGIGFTAMDSRAPWVKGVEAWIGRGLKVGEIVVEVRWSEYHLRRQKMVEALAKQLSERLTAG